MAPIRIAMLSGPRNISTTMMRSFENRDDCVVADEPFYACYLKASGANHPLREETLAAQSSDWKTVAAQLNAREGAAYSFEKHISFHFAFAPDFDWLQGARIFHLIRDPRAMVASYKNKLDNVTPIIDSYRIQRRLYEQKPAPVIDAADVLRAPAATLRALCTALGMPFSEKMLSWPAGPRDSDGAWAPHWYDAVNASTGFKPYKAHELRLSRDLEDIARACKSDYDFFHSRTLVI
ncbi:sulfotransferase-like domain-containing protein [Hyphococcus sp.]|uniref:sulfotransferase-like domain-containing protein n=1 Tax=Hyphococcus sp. TaxID=2038636 RepID=UPI0035C661CB